MKKFVAILLSVVMATSLLVACGDDAGSTDPIKIGILGPHTGAVAEFGLAVRDGALLYINKYNEAGGTPGGRLIEPILFDDEHDPVLALTGYHSLVDQGVVAIIGGVTSGPTMAVVPQGYEDNMPMITASATHPGVTVNQDTGQVYTNMFRTCFIDTFQGEKMADFALNALRAETAAVVFNTDVDYSIALAEAFIAKAEAIGLNVLAIEAYMEEAVDFSGQLTNIAALNPDVMFIPDYHEKISLLSMQARNVGIDATFLGADGWSAVPDAIANLDPVNGSFFISGFSVEDDSPMVQQFLKDYLDVYGVEPIMFAAQAYDAAIILMRAIEAAEAGDYEFNSTEYRTAIINSMAATNDRFVTGNISFDRYNNPIKTAFIIQILDGQAKFWGTF